MMRCKAEARKLVRSSDRTFILPGMKVPHIALEGANDIVEELWRQWRRRDGDGHERRFILSKGVEEDVYRIARGGDECDWPQSLQLALHAARASSL